MSSKAKIRFKVTVASIVNLPAKVRGNIGYVAWKRGSRPENQGSTKPRVISERGILEQNESVVLECTLVRGKKKVDFEPKQLALTVLTEVKGKAKAIGKCMINLADNVAAVEQRRSIPLMGHKKFSEGKVPEINLIIEAAELGKGKAAPSSSRNSMKSGKSNNDDESSMEVSASQSDGQFEYLSYSESMAESIANQEPVEAGEASTESDESVTFSKSSFLSQFPGGTNTAPEATPVSSAATSSSTSSFKANPQRPLPSPPHATSASSSAPSVNGSKMHGKKDDTTKEKEKKDEKKRKHEEHKEKRRSRVSIRSLDALKGKKADLADSEATDGADLADSAESTKEEASDNGKAKEAQMSESSSKSAALHSAEHIKNLKNIVARRLSERSMVAGGSKEPEKSTSSLNNSSEATPPPKIHVRTELVASHSQNAASSPPSLTSSMELSTPNSPSDSPRTESLRLSNAMKKLADQNERREKKITDLLHKLERAEKSAKSERDRAQALQYELEQAQQRITELQRAKQGGFIPPKGSERPAITETGVSAEQHEHLCELVYAPQIRIDEDGRDLAAVAFAQYLVRSGALAAGSASPLLPHVPKALVRLSQRWSDEPGALAAHLNWIISFLDALAGPSSPVGTLVGYNRIRDQPLPLEFTTIERALQWRDRQLVVAGGVEDGFTPVQCFVRDVNRAAGVFFAQICSYMLDRLQVLNVAEVFLSGSTSASVVSSRPFSPFVSWLSELYGRLHHHALPTSVEEQLLGRCFASLNALVMNALLRKEELTASTAYAVKMGVSRVEEWTTRSDKTHTVLPIARGALEMVVAAANVLVIDKGVLAEPECSPRFIFPMLSATHILALLDRFVPDELAPDEVPDAVFAALREDAGDLVFLDPSRLT